MKASEIVVSGKYEGKSGDSRDVVAEGPYLAGYSSQDDLDYIQWRSQNARVGNCTRKAFAAWARNRVGSINLEEATL